MQVGVLSHTTVLACGYPTEEDDDNSSLDVPVSRRQIADTTESADHVEVSAVGAMGRDKFAYRNPRTRPHPTRASSTKMK